MLMEEIRRAGYRIKNTGEMKKEYIEALQYIDVLASQTNTVIDDWDIIQTFFDSSTGIIVTDKNRINQIFFAKYSQKRATDVAFNLSESRRATIDKIATARKAHAIQKIRNDIENKKHKAAQYLNHYTNYAQEISALMNQIRDATALGENISGEIEKIVADGFFTLKEVREDRIEFLTAPIILTHKNKLTGHDITVPVGSFRCAFRFESSYINVYGWKNNIDQYESKEAASGDGYGLNLHPHVSSSEVCYGNVDMSAANAMTMWRLYEAFNILKSVLTTYCDDNPYCPLFIMKQRYDAIVKGEGYGSFREEDEEEEEELEYENQPAADPESENVHF